MKLLLLTLTGIFALNCFSQAPSIQWQKGLSGSQTDFATCIILTTDGGYVSIGDTYSSDGNFTANHGSTDGWVSKFDANGITQWEKVLGGSSMDNFLSIIQTSDGGYIIVGRTYSNDGDISGFHDSPNTTDCWVIKLNNLGNIQWQKSLGGKGSDLGRSVLETSNGGFMICGSTTSFDGDVSANHGTGSTSDYWVINLDANGTIIWEKTYGGSNEDQSFSMSKTIDGGFVIAGMENSTGGDVTIHNGLSFAFNCWVIKINSIGVLQWDKSYLLSSYTAPSCIKQTSDNGFIMSGRSGMVGNQTTFDGLIIKIDSIGNLQWQKSCGGTQQDDLISVVEVGNGEYVASGVTHSNDGDITNYLGGTSDCWLLRFDLNGNIVWKKTYGGSDEDGMSVIQKTNDNSFIAAGYSSSIDFDVTTNSNNSSVNTWIVKFNPLSVGIEETKLTTTFSLHPNPANDVININATKCLINQTYILIDALGQIVLDGKLENQNTVINLQKLTSGFYTLQIGDKKKQSYKLIIE